MKDLDANLLINALIVFAVAGVISFASSPLVRMFAIKFKLMDVPEDDRRMHTVPTPRLGGLAVFLGFLFSVLLLVPITYELRGILIGAVVIVIMAAIDDAVKLHYIPRFITQIFAACIPVFFGVRIEAFSNFHFSSAEPYFDLGFLSIPATIIWIVLLTNAVNWIDGLDGLSTGVSTISAFSIFLVSLLLPEPLPLIALVMAAVCGACVGFLPYNKFPAKMFIGDSGAMFLGYILATMSILGLFKFYAVVSFAVPFLILGLPIFESVTSILRRVLRGKNPMKGDRGHIHHRLIDMGLSQKQAVAILYVASAILGLAAVVLATSGELRAILLIVSGVVAAVVALWVYSSRHKTQEDIELQESEQESKQQATQEPAQEQQEVGGENNADNDGTENENDGENDRDG